MLVSTYSGLEHEELLTNKATTTSWPFRGLLGEHPVFADVWIVMTFGCRRAGGEKRLICIATRQRSSGKR